MLKASMQLARARALSWPGLLLAAVVYAGVNALFSAIHPGVRLDVTEEGLYTLSDGTFDTLAKIDQPLQLHFFASERLGRTAPFYASYGRRIRDLLVEIAAASNGKAVLHEHNPEPFSDDEDMAVAFGIQGIPIDQSGELAYFGLAGRNSTGDTENIPFFQAAREHLLEYDLVRMIHDLSNIDPAVVGVMSSLPLMGDMNAQAQGEAPAPAPWVIAKRLRKNFKIVTLSESIDALPPEIGIMMVVHPQALSARAVYALEQFLFRGGKAMLFIDPKAEASPGEDGISASTGLQPLFERWGIEIPEGRLLGDRSLAMRVNAGPAARPVLTDYLVWLTIPGGNMAQDDPVTSRLPSLNLASAGYILRAEDSPLRLEPLIFSGIDSSPIAVEDAGGLNPDVFGILDRFKPDNNTYVIAARLSGEVATAFPDGPPPRAIARTEEELAQNPEPVHLMKSVGPINVIVTADADLLEDRFWVRKQRFFGREIEDAIAGNADFVINALGNLAGGDGLITLRSRGVSQRPFEKVTELQQQAERRLQDRERELQRKHQQMQSKIAKLEGARTTTDAATGAITLEASLSEEQLLELEALKRDMLSIRGQLRDVRRSLREDVERLETWLQFVNIGLIPIIISGIAGVFGFVRMARSRRHYARARERAAA
ncbi:MAG: Gldg family protein [Gammaproteobacteria bacterium]